MGVDERYDAWADYAATPWGRLRYALVGGTLRRVLAGLGPGPHRVLDVGGGDALDSAPLAADGHEVVVVDPSARMVAEAAARGVRAVVGGLDDVDVLAATGEHDLVLCHFVLHYRPPELLETDLEALVARVRPGGLLSIVLPNPDGMVLGRAVREGPAAALALLGSSTVPTVTFGTDVRLVPTSEVLEPLLARGFELVARCGGRVVNDLVGDEVKNDPDRFAELLALEEALHDREPFNRVGFYAHLVLRKPGSGEVAVAEQAEVAVTAPAPRG